MAVEEQVPAPPVGEELHLPGPSLTPMLNAVGISVALIGLAVGWVILVAGLILFVVTTVMWISDVRRDIDDLPLEHGH